MEHFAHKGALAKFEQEKKIWLEEMSFFFFSLSLIFKFPNSLETPRESRQRGAFPELLSSVSMYGKA